MLNFIIWSLFFSTTRANYDPEDVQPEVEGVWEKSQACGFTEVFYLCKPCDLLCGQDHKLCPIKKCQEGCGCPPNFRRNAEGDCVEYFDCFSNLRPTTVGKSSSFDSTTSVPVSQFHYQRVMGSQPRIIIGQNTNRSAHQPTTVNNDGMRTPVIRTENFLKAQTNHNIKPNFSNAFPIRFNPTVTCEKNYFPFRSELDCLKFLSMKFQVMNRRVSRSL